MRKYLAVITAVMAITGLMVMPAFGGNPKLIVKDSTPSANTVFVVQDTGNVGIGTDNPVYVLDVYYPLSTDGTTFHSVLDNSPAANKATQDTFSGSSLASGSANNLRGSRGTFASPLPLTNGDRIGSFFFQGNVGTGTANYKATASIEALVDTGTVSTTSLPTYLKFTTTAAGSVTRVERMRITSNGTLRMAGGAYTDGHQWYPSSSRELKENIQALDSKEAMTALEGLNPVKYNYRDDKEQNHVGFIAEDVPDLVALNGRKGLSPLDIVAVLTKVAQEQEQALQAQRQALEEKSRILEAQQKAIAALTEKIEKLDRALQSRGKLASILDYPN